LRVIRGLALSVVLGVAALVVVVVLARVRYPYELEWMEGAIFDHVERVRNGQPLYVPPSAAWTPFLYPPAYYWVAAWASRVLPEVLACRVVSLVSTGAATTCVYLLARRLDAGRYWAVLASALYVACFGFTLEWYDIARADSLFVALVALSAVLVLSSRGIGGAAGAGAVLGIAFFVKQPALAFLAAVPAGLWLAGQRRRAIALAAAGVAVAAPIFVLLEAGSSGWFAYYCVKLPAAHGFDSRYVTLFFVRDLSTGFLLTLATVAGVLGGAGRAPPERVTFAAYLLAAFVASATSRLHAGGWTNVLMFWTVFACPAAACGAARAEALARSTPSAKVVGAAACGLFALQAGLFAPDPFEAIPSSRHRDFDEHLRARVLDLERGGEVTVLGRGHVTRERHLHITALVDVRRAGGGVPDDLNDAILTRRWAAFVVDDFAELDFGPPGPPQSAVFDLVARNYFVAERFDSDAPAPVVGFAKVPRWVLRPRRVPLGLTDHAALARRVRAEMGLAERNMRLAQADPGHVYDGLEIEEQAAEALPQLDVDVDPPPRR
jgi:hypothetical protein